MEEELARERICEQKELAREEIKLKREFEKEQRLMRKVMQERQVMWLKKHKEEGSLHELEVFATFPAGVSQKAASSIAGCPERKCSPCST